MTDSVVATLVIMKLEPSTTAVVEFNEQRKVLKSSVRPETPLPLLVNGKNAVFAVGLLRFKVSCRINMIVPLATGSMSMTLSQQNKPQLLLTICARVPLPNTAEKVGDVLEMADAPALMDLLEDANQAIELESETMNSICYI